ncbi:MAG: hypothetical protein IJ209_07510 [Bacteroidaceae bacterium]|nr:hypothetical protein [Bacteroidaceae bacterium]
MNNDNNLFRQALQRQAKQAAEMKMPDDMEQRVMVRIKPGFVLRRWLYPLSAIAAILVAAAFLLIVPQVRERREWARYEGSYMVVDGQRISDLKRIRAYISEALAMAQVAEASVPPSTFASETERAILQAADGPEMQAVVQRILNDE